MISDLKSKLPFKNKGKAQEEEDLEVSEEITNDGDKTDPSMNLEKTGVTEINDTDDVIEEDDRPQSLIDKIKAKIIPSKRETKNDDDQDETEVGVKKPKKKISPLTVIIVIAGLAFFLMETEEEQPPVPVVTKRKSLKRPKKQEPTESAVEAPVETPADATSETTTEAPTDVPAETTAEAPTDVPAETTAEAPTDVPAETTTEAPTDVPAETTTEAPTETPVETTTDTSNQTPIEAAPSEDTVDGSITVPSDNETMTDKILEDLEKQVKKEQLKEEKKEYVAPPDYEYKGRGMVYNCAGKHWACVDGPSYKNCEDNYSSSKYLKKPIECYPFNVYDNQKGCEAMQNRLVSSNAKTDFCKGD